MTVSPRSSWLRSPKGERVRGGSGSGGAGNRPAGKARVGPVASCVCCGTEGPIMARGLRELCYNRWRRLGKLERFPLTRKEATYSLEFPAVINRAEAYRELTTGVGALGRTRACIVLGISTRTAYRYEAWIRAQQKEG